jgi:hypothetical protein
MKITKTTKLSECSSIITQDDINTIESKVDDSYIKKFPSIVNNTVGEFIMLLRGDQEYLKEFFLKNENDITVYEYCAKLKHLKKEITKVSDHLKNLSIKQTVNEIEAAKGVLFPSFEENILIYCQQKFFLNSIRQAEEILLCDFLLLKKNDMANIKFEKNLRKITEPKFKK